MIRTERGWKCGQEFCNYLTTNKGHLKRHIESKHVDTGGAQCDHCQMILSTRNALYMHVQRHHPHLKKPS